MVLHVLVEIQANDPGEFEGLIDREPWGLEGVSGQHVPFGQWIEMVLSLYCGKLLHSPSFHLTPGSIQGIFGTNGVAAVFWPEVPQSFWGHPVINGDNHDARFLDMAGTIVGLKAKGSAKTDQSGFVIRNSQSLPENDEQFALAA